MPRKKEKPQIDQSIRFIQEHHFKDTLALLVVFLSFNHFASLCLLSIFIVTTRSRFFLATCFIKIFLSKDCSPELLDSAQKRTDCRTGSTAKSQQQLADQDQSTDRQQLQQQQDEKSTGGQNTSTRLSTISPLFVLEIVVASILKIYAGQYFARPIENLAMSIIASSLINDPRDCLSYATSCSILYGLSLNFYHRVSSLLNLQFLPMQTLPSSPLQGWPVFTSGYAIIDCMFSNASRIVKWSRRYVRICCYFASVHIVFSQFFKSMTNPYYFRAASKAQTSSGPPKSTSMSPNNSQSTALYGSSPLPSASGSSSCLHPGNSSGPPLLSNPNTNGHKAKFSSFVKEFTISELSINSPSESNQQTVTTNVTSQSNSEPGEIPYTNHFFEVHLDSESKAPSGRNLDAYFISTANLENFIMQLFKWKNRHLIPPLWSIFTTIKTMTLERKQVRGETDAASTSAPVATEAQTITPTSSNTVLNSSVFTGPDSTDCMMLIAPAADDYNQLHLVPHKQAPEYRVCIYNTGPTQITFHITNLFEGELIVLVNGVIWSQVLSAITSEKLGEEYTVVSGLVPSCSYDIQFVNRFNEEDYLIADLMVRTCNKNGESKDPLDFSFPSYYHRKFLSPLLTLKHSVLTTNTNLAEERAKLKKTKKEASKKLASLRQQIDHLKSKISQNASQDGKSAFKMDNLKTVLQQSETQLTKLEDELKDLLEQEQQVEREHLQQKDRHLRNQMEYGKLQTTLEIELEEYSTKLSKLEQELTQLKSKRDKVSMKQEKLKKEVTQCTEDMENLKAQFLQQRKQDRERREELRVVEANEIELKNKGLEQDISRLEGENEAMHNLVRNF
ncbi:Nnf2p [Lachancea thermotolerans CBS 6340]|uniref:KLTH0F12144p n=1 Tax=Lachancea thermotolerans (strain ATCC 56472 / CBS 6340 / NRRL Y-8284) TaxID=559295 RepID=C5DLD7_LACTC|nr:KLTH0F12144p [Lachancea thermotolerans CBS 6340]CAR24288.1 KLTH0F12144p [Lachancea thermotolerans CBS 6340]